MHKSSALKVLPQPGSTSVSQAPTRPQPPYADGNELAHVEQAELEFSDREPESQVFETRDQRRSRRKRDVRALTINMTRFSQSALEVGRRLQPEIAVEKPKTRSDCAFVPRPCPFVSCRHHLYLDVSPRTGSIKLNFPDLDVDELKNSCSLDVAEAGALTAEDLGEVMNLTRERVRQLERRGLAHAFEQLDPTESSP